MKRCTIYCRQCREVFELIEYRHARADPEMYASFKIETLGNLHLRLFKMSRQCVLECVSSKRLPACHIERTIYLHFSHFSIIIYLIGLTFNSIYNKISLEMRFI